MCSSPNWPRRGLKASAHAADIREPDAVSALFDTVWAAHGRLDILVNSAGGQFPQAAIDFSVKGWNTVINTNLNGTWYMMQAAAQRWRDRKHPGSIVNIVVVTTHGLYGIAHSVAARCRRDRAVARGRGRMGAAEHPRQLRGARRDRDRGLERLYARGPRGLSALEPDDARGLAMGHRRSQRLPRRPSGKFVTGETLTVDGGGQLWGETWTTGKPDYFGGADK